MSYEDADDGSGNLATRTDSASAGCLAPSISGVQVLNVTGTDADILWTTSEGAYSLVTYGLAASPPPASPAANAAFVTSHSVRAS